MKRIEDFYVGQQAEFKQTINAEIVSRFVELTGDNNPLHVDAEYAEKSPFKGIVTHGMLSASFISTMVGKHIPGDGALWVSQSLQFLLPVRLNDVLTIVAEITKISTKERLLTLNTTILNQHGQKVLTGEGQVKLLEIKTQNEASSNKEVSSKVVLITGASRSIGAAISKRIAKDGHMVIVNYRNDKEGAERVVNEITKEGGEAISFQADITNESDVDRMFSFINTRGKGLYALINNASPKIIEKRISESTWDDFSKQIDGQLKGAFLCSERALRIMNQQREGVIVNIASSVTQGVPPTKWSAYTIAKASIVQFTKCLALEEGSNKIRVNAISPGMVDTQFVADIPEKYRLLQAAQTPLRRLAEVDDIAGTVAFLLSKDASYITGANIMVAGGKVMY